MLAALVVVARLGGQALQPEEGTQLEAIALPPSNDGEAVSASAVQPDTIVPVTSPQMVVITSRPLLQGGAQIKQPAARNAPQVLSPTVAPQSIEKPNPAPAPAPALMPQQALPPQVAAGNTTSASQSEKQPIARTASQIQAATVLPPRTPQPTVARPANVVSPAAKDGMAQQPVTNEHQLSSPINPQGN